VTGGDEPPPSRPRAAFSGVRGRLFALATAATIPIAGIAGSNAWVAYQSALAQGPRNALILREVAAARHGAAMEALREVVTGLAVRGNLLDMSPEACDERLARLRELTPERYSNFWVLDTEGRLVCSGLPATRGESYAGLDYVSLVARTRAFQFGEFTIGSLSQRAVLPGAAPILGPGDTLRGMVGGSLFLGFFLRSDRGTQVAGQYSVWLIDQDGSVLPFGNALAAALPPPEVLARIGRDGEEELQGRARDGTDYAWSAQELEPGLRLLVGLQVEGEVAAARAALLRRLLELGVFLTGCLAAIVLGVELAVSRPLRRLAARVRDWAPGRPFAPDPNAGGPEEVRDLDRVLVVAAMALTEREEALTGALRQRDLLMAEIHHRVKNNLQIVASLLNLQAGRLRSPAAQAEFAIARDRVQALATLHRHLYLHHSFERISLRPFLEELSRQLGDALGTGPDSGIAIRIAAEDVELSSDQAISLALLITESVSNAMRYAFPDGLGGTIDISLVVEGDEALLIISDDGVGLGGSEPAGDGLGLQLIEGFAAHLGGSAEIAGEHGTRITVRFPIHHRSLEDSLRGAA
jgi:two-component sensor histidine kinase